MNHVLIIDADLENCKRIKYSLQNVDTAVYYTHSVMEAFAMIWQNPYTLIWTEWHRSFRLGAVMTVQVLPKHCKRAERSACIVLLEDAAFHLLETEKSGGIKWIK